MNVTELRKADRPTFYFIGVTTGKSSIMRVFPKWAARLGLGDCPIKGIDCKWHDDPQVYRQVVSFLKNDPLSLGALVTTHKIDLLDAAGDIFDELDPYAQLLGEISCISKRNGKLRGHAKDPITSGSALEGFLPGDHWCKTGGEACILGAGGSSLAFTTYFMKIAPPGRRPAKILVTNRSVPRLEAMKRVHARINPGIDTEYHHCPNPQDNDKLVNRLPAGSLVANATGLGKDAPGSPITDAARFPQRGFAWDFNYRGDLTFLAQANEQKQARSLHVEDGWLYFIHGWTRVIAEVFDIEIPTKGPEFDKLSRIAAEAR
jgi:shikimate 5-dehydrogenase